MAQNSQAIDLAEALNRLSRHSRFEPARRTRPVSESLGHLLATDVTAPMNMPPFPASAMDGYAVRRADFEHGATQRFRVIGRSLAGHPYSGAVQAGEAVRIFTGALVPAGADLVILQEELASAEDGEDASEFVTFKTHRPSESFIRPIGHDVRKGSQVAERGERITPFLLGTLTAYGIPEVELIEPLRIGIFSTGDELVDINMPPGELAPGQIYDSNRATVLALLDDPVFETVDLGRLPDELAPTKDFLAASSQEVDVLITSGGVSVGEADYVTRAITELGELNIWKLKLKPGKPMAVGTIGNCTIFGLPGNPVSTVVTLLLVAKPTMLNMLGAKHLKPLSLPAVLANDLRHQPGRTEYQRGTLVSGVDGLKVSSTGDQSSNRLMSFAAANCLIEIDQASGDLAAGSMVNVLPFWGLVGAL